MMDDKNSSWREIHQQLFSPAITPVAKRRRRFATLKRIGVFVLVVGLLAGLVGTVVYLRGHSQTFAPYAQDNQKTKIEFFSDGQLTGEHFQKQFPKIRGKSLLTIDIASVQAALLKNPQILSATVERHFPDTLKITLRERAPIARAKLKIEGKTDTYLLSSDGVFFRSSHYKPAPNLPYITGIKINIQGSQIEPLEGAASLGEILNSFKDRFKDLNPLIASIDLNDWNFPATAKTSVAVKLRNNATLRFGYKDIQQQLDRLGEVVTLLKDEKDTLANKLVDLTYPDKVAIVGTR